ncbi:MAG: glycoside hydrolase family 92 protein, partial [Bacteroidales bacterium]|nr:glycoside hydrolase family 92 protein [Bacteroidales bacterium]
PVCPGDNQYVFGSPMFDNATIHLENGKDIVIVAKNQSDNNKYIKAIKLNGKDYTKSYITYNDIKDGAIIEFTMSSKPNMEFGVAKEDCPKSKIDAKAATVPYFSTSSKVFRDSILLEIKCTSSEKSNVIYYTTDGSDPTNNSALYEQPLLLTADATIKAVAYSPELGYSKVAECNLVKYSQDKKITYHTKY